MIQIKTDTRDKIKSLGKMGETYDDVLQRLYEQAFEMLLAKNLLNTSNTTDIEEILKKRNLI